MKSYACAYNWRAPSTFLTRHFINTTRRTSFLRWTRKFILSGCRLDDVNFNLFKDRNFFYFPCNFVTLGAVKVTNRLGLFFLNFIRRQKKRGMMSVPQANIMDHLMMIHKGTTNHVTSPVYYNNQAPYVISYCSRPKKQRPGIISFSFFFSLSKIEIWTCSHTTKKKSSREISPHTPIFKSFCLERSTHKNKG